MLHGMPPYNTDSLEGLKEMFVQKKMTVKKNLSYEIKELLKMLLRTNHEK